MSRKPLTIPPEAAQAFMKDLRAYHRTRDKDKRTLIAARQAEALAKHSGQRVSMEEIYDLLRRMRP